MEDELAALPFSELRQAGEHGEGGSDGGEEENRTH